MKDNFEQRVRQKVEAFDRRPSKQVWQNIETSLPNTSFSNFLNFPTMIKLLSVLAIVSGLTWVGVQKQTTITPTEKVAVNSNLQEEKSSNTAVIEENILQEKTIPKTTITQPNTTKKKPVPTTEIIEENDEKNDTITTMPKDLNTKEGFRIVKGKSKSQKLIDAKGNIIEYSKQGTTTSTELWKKVKDKVKISITYNKISNTIYELKYMFKMKDDWQIYYKGEDGGPIYMTFDYSDFENAKFLTPEPTLAVIPKMIYDPLFGVNMQTIKGKKILTHKFEVLDKGIPIKIKGGIEYMIGNDKSCYPPLSYAFEFKIK